MANPVLQVRRRIGSSLHKERTLQTSLPFAYSVRMVDMNSAQRFARPNLFPGFLQSIDSHVGINLRIPHQPAAAHLANDFSNTPRLAATQDPGAPRFDLDDNCRVNVGL